MIFWRLACTLALAAFGAAWFAPVVATVTHWIPCVKDSECDDGNQCTVDRCDFYGGAVGPGQGQWYCFHSPYDGCANTMPVSPPVTAPCEEDLQCDDHNPCTEEFCNASGSCYSGMLVDGRTCSDGRAIQGVCVAGLCHF